MDKPVRILSIDGGGIRGVLPATFLSVLEEKLQETSGNKNLRLADCFDLIAGTSTGGLLTCMYLTPDDNNALIPKYTARQALEFYFGYGDSAFTPNAKGGFHKYSPAGLEAGLNKFFGNLKLSQLIKPCCITAYDMIHCEPFIFYSHRAISDPRANYYIKDVARATSALPGIFPPATIASCPTGNALLLMAVFLHITRRSRPIYGPKIFFRIARIFFCFRLVPAFLQQHIHLNKLKIQVKRTGPAFWPMLPFRPTAIWCIINCRKYSGINRALLTYACNPLCMA